MIEITERLTRVTVLPDQCFRLEWGDNTPLQRPQLARSPTGARVSVEFCRASALAPDEAVHLRYEFANGGRLRDAIGVPKHTRAEMRSGGAWVHYYRLEHWIPPAELRETALQDA